MSRAIIAIALLATTGAIVGCAGLGGDSSGIVGADNPRIRVVTGLPDVNAVDVFVASDHVLNDAGFGTVSEYTVENNGNRTVRFLDATSQGELASHTSLFEEDRHYTVVATGTAASGRTVIKLTDGRDEAGGGRAKVRVVNAAQNLGTVDVYITPTGTANDLTGVVPTADNVAFADEDQAYVFLDPGHYRVRVTGSDNQTVVLDTTLSVQADQIRTLLLLQGATETRAVILADRG